MSAGFDSPVFAVAAVVAFIVMYDAAHVRRETGEQAKVLNYILRNWEEFKPENFERDLKELIGLASTTPRLEARWPPVLETPAMICSRSWSHSSFA